MPSRGLQVIKVTRGVALAVLCATLVAAAGVLYQNQAQRNPRIVFGRFSLPAYDAWVYVAMAENPAVFTVAPWGYRWLTPAVVSRLPLRTVTAGYRVLTVCSLALCGVLLAFYLLSVGARPWFAALAVAAFVFSPSVADIVRYRYLVDPLTALLWVLFLLAMTRPAPAGILALVAVLGVLSKDVFFLAIPQILAPDGRHGGAQRVRRFAFVLLVAIAARAVLHSAWPSPSSSVAAAGLPLSAGFFAAALQGIMQSWRDWIGPLALGGLTPLALICLLRPAARDFAKRNAYLIIATLALPFAAGAWTGDGRFVDFYEDDVARLLVYALPWILALLALGIGGRAQEEGAAARPLWPPLAAFAGWICTALVMGGLWLGLDRYRRADFSGSRDGPLILSASRGSLRIARLLEENRGFDYDFETQGLPFYSEEPARLGEIRWFLRDGFGIREEKATGIAVLREPAASLLVPVLTPRDVLLTLVFAAPPQEPIGVSLNGRELGSLSAADANDPAAAEITLPKSTLYRGDNVVTLLRGTQQAAAIRKLSLR